MMGQNITDSSAIFDYLSSNYQDFGAETLENRQNTAQAIANRIWEMQAQWDNVQQRYDQYMGNVDNVLRNELDRNIQSLGQDLQRAWTVWLDRPTEDLTTQRDQRQRALDRALEDTRFAINNQIEDVAIESQRNIDMAEKIGALKWFNKSGWYVQGIQNIKWDADRAIGRLQTTLARAEWATGEAKQDLLDQFNREMTRVKEDFQYQMRDVMDLWKIELNSVLSKYWYSEDKVFNEVQRITSDIITKRQQIESNYINNARSNIALMNDQLDVITNYEAWENQQRDRFVATINIDGGAALANMTMADLQSFVDQWYLAPEQAEWYKQLMLGKSVWALQAMGMPTEQDVLKINELIRWGMSPNAAIASVVQSNPTRYMTQNTPERKSLPWAEWTLYSVWPDGMPIYSQAPWSQPRYTQELPANIKEVPPASTESIQTAYSKYVNMKDGSQVRWGQCGEFVNDYIKEATGINYNMFVDPIDTRMLQANTNTPTVWSVIIIDRWDKAKTKAWRQYGHVGIVTWYDPKTKTITYKDQNGKNAKKVGTWSIKMGSNTRFFDPRLGLSKEKASEQVSKQQSLMKKQVVALTQWLWWTAWERAQMQNDIISTANEYDITLSEAKKMLWYKSDDDIKFAEQRQTNINKVMWQSDAVNNAKMWLNMLKKENTAVGDVAVLFSFLKALDPTSVAREWEIAAVQNAQSVLGRLEVKFASLSSWRKLSSQQRKELESAFNTIVWSYDRKMRQELTKYKREFDERWLDLTVYVPQETIDKYTSPQQQTNGGVSTVQSMLWNPLQVMQWGTKTIWTSGGRWKK